MLRQTGLNTRDIQGICRLSIPQGSPLQARDLLG